MNEPYKVDINVPLPDIWIKNRDSMLIYRATGRVQVRYSNQPNGPTTLSAPPGMDDYIDIYLLEQWNQGFAQDWSFSVYEEWIAARQASPMSASFLMFYDNTDPLKGTTGRVRYTFSSRDAALMFKLSWTAA